MNESLKKILLVWGGILLCLHLSIPVYADDWDKKYGEFFFLVFSLFTSTIYSVISVWKIRKKERPRSLAAFLFIFSVLIYGCYIYIKIIIIKNENGFYTINAETIKDSIFSIWGLIDLIIITGIFLNVKFLIEYLIKEFKQTKNQ